MGSAGTRIRTLFCLTQKSFSCLPRPGIELRALQRLGKPSATEQFPSLKVTPDQTNLCSGLEGQPHHNSSDVASLLPLVSLLSTTSDLLPAKLKHQRISRVGLLCREIVLESPKKGDITPWGEGSSVAVGVRDGKLCSSEGSWAERRWEIYCSGRI